VLEKVRQGRSLLRVVSTVSKGGGTFSMLRMSMEGTALNFGGHTSDFPRAQPGAASITSRPEFQQLTR